MAAAIDAINADRCPNLCEFYREAVGWCSSCLRLSSTVRQTVPKCLPCMAANNAAGNASSTVSTSTASGLESAVDVLWTRMKEVATTASSRGSANWFITSDATLAVISVIALSVIVVVIVVRLRSCSGRQMSCCLSTVKVASCGGGVGTTSTSAAASGGALLSGHYDRSTSNSGNSKCCNSRNLNQNKLLQDGCRLTDTGRAHVEVGGAGAVSELAVTQTRPPCRESKLVYV